MQTATLPTWLSPAWPSDILYGPRKYKTLDYYRAIARERARQRSRLTIYTYGNDDSQILRIGGWSGRVNTARPMAGWERYPLESLPLDTFEAPPPPDLSHLPGRVNVEWVNPTMSVPLFLKSTLRAWLFGAALLALLVMLVRALNKCLDMGIKKARRRSQEWPTPNLRATSRQAEDNGTIIIPGFENEEPYPADFGDAISIDLPPPYSQCTDSDPTASTSYAHKFTDIVHEEPPPPYSDCYVEFSNKNGIPSVLIFSRKRSPLVNRREILGSDTVVNEDETEINTENNPADHNADSASTNDNQRNDDTTNVTITIIESQSNPGTPGTSSGEEVGDAVDSPHKDRVSLV